MIYLCLYPWQFNFARPFTLFNARWYVVRSNGDLVDCVANFFFYFPIGFSSFLYFRHPHPRLRLALAVLIGAALSCAVEVIQVYIPTRNSSFRDVFFNTAGAAVGAALARLTLRTGGTSRRWSPYLPQDPFAWVLFTLWAIWQAFPFIPILRIYKLKEAVASLLNPTFPFVNFGDVTFALMLLYAACGSRGGGLPLIAALLLPLQLALPEQTLYLHRIAAAALGLLLSLGLARLPKRTSALLLAWMLLFWLAVRGCYPFQFGEAQNFTWMPFDAITTSFRAPLARTIAGKFLLYSGAIWALYAARYRLWNATLLVLAVLAMVEFTQIHLPAHVPESTDLAIALFGALLIKITSPETR